MVVYVLDVNGNPIMPTSRFGKVRRLLKDKKAKVIRRNPFTIKLLYKTETHVVQSCVLGIDTGSAHVGTAVYSKGKILYISQVNIRNDIKSKMDDRRGYRRGRRFRHTRYRKPRFLNRKNSIRRDRFSPTMMSKYQSHIREIDFIKSILPISQLVLETGTFDTHLLKNPSLANPKIRHWGYQKGKLYGFENAKAYILTRDNYICQCCKGKHKDSKLEVHHIVYRSQGGSDEESNLITLCETCHKKLHKGELRDFESKLHGTRKGTLKHATQMNSIRIQLLKHYPDAIETFGYITKANRQALSLSKDHYIDACVIASCGKPFNIKSKTYYKRVVGNGTRILAKFRKVPIHLDRGKIRGFRRYDKVKYRGKEYFIYARSKTGNFCVTDIFGNKPDFGIKTLGSVNPKYLNKIDSRGTVLYA